MIDRAFSTAKPTTNLYIMSRSQELIFFGFPNVPGAADSKHSAPLVNGTFRAANFLANEPISVRAE
jgi:alanine dehydrogenase